MGENCFPISIRSRRVKFTIVASLIVIIGLAVGVYAYSQIQQQEIIRFLTRYHAYSPDFKYQPLDVMDVDSLPKSGGNITVQNLIIDYAFNQPDEYDNVPYLKVTYLAGPPCNVSQFPSPENCHEMLVIIPINNVTTTNSLSQIHALYAGPLNNFGFDLQTETGAHIEWYLYLFLATYTGNSSGGLQA